MKYHTVLMLDDRKEDLTPFTVFLRCSVDGISTTSVLKLLFLNRPGFTVITGPTLWDEIG